MDNAFDPEVGQWYRHFGKAGVFQVVALDDEEDLVEIQYFDGDIEELPREEWRSMPIEPWAQPEDWTGPFGVVDAEDRAVGDAQMGEESRVPKDDLPAVPEQSETD